MRMYLQTQIGKEKHNRDIFVNMYLNLFIVKWKQIRMFKIDP